MHYGLSGLTWRLVSGVAIVALSAGAAMAQEGVEQVTVSSTRLQNTGFEAPTPTTVMSAADLQTQAQPNVFDTLTQLPAVQGSTGAAAQAGTTSNGLLGLSAIGLRGLSPLLPWFFWTISVMSPPTKTAPWTSAGCRRCWSSAWTS